MEPGRNLAPELALSQPVYFYGTQRPKDSLDPAKFLAELNNRQARHAWTDAEALQYFKSCLRTEAANWWEGSIEYSFDYRRDVLADHPSRNWKAAQQAFREHYGLSGATYRIWWRDIVTQKSGEDAMAYMQRANVTIGQYLREHTERALTDGYCTDMETAAFKQVVKNNIYDPEPREEHDIREYSDKVTVMVDKIQRSVNNRYNMVQGNPAERVPMNMNAMRDDINRIIQASVKEMVIRAQDEATTALLNLQQRAHERTRLEMTRFMQAELVFEGLSSPELRIYAKDLVAKQHETGDSYTKICDLVYARARGNKAGGRCLEVDAAPEPAQPEEDQEVAAAKAKPKNDKKKNKKKSGTKPDNGKTCTFCQNKGHTDKECRTKAICLKNKHKLLGSTNEVEAQGETAQGNEEGVWKST